MVILTNSLAPWCDMGSPLPTYKFCDFIFDATSNKGTTH
jgi:hypothetical protein